MVAEDATLPCRLFPYMATIAELESDGKLLAYEPDFEANEFPTRWIHIAPTFPTWLEKTLRSEVADDGRNISPYEQVEQVFYEYALGRPMVYGRDRRKLDPLTQHVWEVKTPDVRVFGWLPQKRHLIVVCGTMKRDLKPSKKYDPHIQNVITFRNGLDLSVPKFLTGLTPNEIC
jgi:hypothetical protein